jgi:hypothetical protein
MVRGEGVIVNVMVGEVGGGYARELFRNGEVEESDARLNVERVVW